jgi:hypothetical protein
MLSAPRPAARLALAAALVAAVATARPAASGAASHPGSARRVLVIGLDGADWQAVDPLVRAGRLPVFARLRACGRTGTLLATPPLLSPILWTTIATGRRPEDHRILDFMVDLANGGQAPMPSTERRVEALWNLFSDAGRSVAVVGWWATYPAEDVNGTIVSDRVAPQLLRGDVRIDPHAISPASRAAALASPVATFLAVTVAPGTAARLWSSTRPSITPTLPWAWAVGEETRPAATHKNAMAIPGLRDSDMCTS